MNQNIWGCILMYCYEHNIDFDKVYTYILKTNHERYTNTLLYYGQDNHNIELQFSTIQSDINILTNIFKIPTNEYINIKNYEDKVVRFLANLNNTVDSMYIEYDVTYEEDELSFNVIYKSVQPNIIYIVTKYLDTDNFKFKYKIRVILNFISWMNRSKVLQFEDIPETITIYDNDSKIISNYFDSIFKNCHFISWDNKINCMLDDFIIIDFKNIIVRSSIKKCNIENHNTQIINGIFFVVDNKSNDILIKKIPLVFCPNCNKYFLYDFEYTALRSSGKVLCKIYKQDQLNSIQDFSKLTLESVFKICGYTVDQNEDLSEKARHNILDFLIKRKITTVIQTLNFLQWLINTRKNNINMYNAVKKWEQDFIYVNDKYNTDKSIIII